MNAIFYNPMTRDPKPYMAEGLPVDPSRPGYRFDVQRAFADRQTALRESKFQWVDYWEGEVLMRARFYRAWEFKPLNLEDPLSNHNGGINWGDTYFPDEVSVNRFVERLIADGKRHDAPVYDEVYDVWSVHFHY